VFYLLETQLQYAADNVHNDGIIVKQVLGGNYGEG
jgi:hypothetical protein